MPGCAGLSFVSPGVPPNGFDRPHPDTDADWLVPSGEQQGLRRYVQTIRERFKLIVLTVLVTTLAAVLYVGTAEKTYEARATLLVTPVPRDNATLDGLSPITASSDPTRDVTTAAEPGHDHRRRPGARRRSCRPTAARARC